jgi:hypothetical protein
MYTFHFPGASAVGAAWRRGLLALALGGSALCAGPAAAQALGGYLPAASFTRTYHGSDGSVLSMRRTGSQVVGYSQDGAGARAWIFVGQRSGRTLTGNVVMLPRGAQRTPVRALTLSFSAAGSQLGHLSGEDAGSRSWIAKLPSSFVFPQGGETRLQSTLASDMDGVYRGNDGSRPGCARPATARCSGTPSASPARRAAGRPPPPWVWPCVARRASSAASRGTCRARPRRSTTAASWAR